MTAVIIGQISGLFDRFGSESYGKDATQLQHALQVAELARRQGCTLFPIAVCWGGQCGFGGPDLEA